MGLPVATETCVYLQEVGGPVSILYHSVLQNMICVLEGKSLEPPLH